MNLKEAYTILEVPQDASPEDAKKKYRELTKKYHPDVNKEPGNEDRFKKINEAYKVVSTGESTDREAPQQWTGSPFHPFVQQQQQRIVTTIELHTTISFKDSILGCKKDLKFVRNGKCNSCSGQGVIVLNNGCDKCGGRGEIVNQRGNMIFTRTCEKCQGRTKSEACSPCQGTGTTKMDVSIQVNVPGGVSNGNVLRLGGMGNYAGSMFTMDQFTDAHLHINVTPEEGLSLEGQDVVCSLEISLLEALRGCKKSIKTVIGDKEVVVKAKSRNKEEVIMPHLGVSRVGNQRVILDVKYPSNTDKLIGVLVDEVI